MYKCLMFKIHMLFPSHEKQDKYTKVPGMNKSNPFQIEDSKDKLGLVPEVDLLFSK